jgi:hypothetical protein
VKRLALAAVLLSALGGPALAHAELVPGTAGAQDSLLAVDSNGSPVVAFVDGAGSIALSTRSSDGVWTSQPVPFARTAARSAVVGLAAHAGRAVVLAEATSGAWLALAEQTGSGWRVRTVATAPAKGVLGFGSLALDAQGRPLVAYTSLLQSRKSALRLVHEDARGRLIGEAITRLGFPKSEEIPMAAPVVLPSGAVRVVEVYSGAAIEWTHKRDGRSWTGQFLYANSLGQPAGTVHAAAKPGGGVWSAWTELFPNYDESHVVLALHADGENATVLSHHALVISLAATPAGAEVAGDDYVDLEGGRTVYAGLVLGEDGTPTELAGNLEGYALDPAGGRQYLLLDAAGLGWYQAASLPSATVSLAAAVDGAAFVLSGRVTGASGGTVELWRETQAGSELAGTLPVAADGTFAASDTPPSRPLTYRAVYRDPTSGLPLASLVRSILGA